MPKRKDQFKNFTLQRMWNGIASIRDYNIQQCLDEKLGIRINLKDSGLFMEIPFEELEQKMFQAHQTEIKSKYGKNYKLIDFAWRPTNSSKKPQNEPLTRTCIHCYKQHDLIYIEMKSGLYHMAYRCDAKKGKRGNTLFRTVFVPKIDDLPIKVEVSKKLQKEQKKKLMQEIQPMLF